MKFLLANVEKYLNSTKTYSLLCMCRLILSEIEHADNPIEFEPMVSTDTFTSPCIDLTNASMTALYPNSHIVIYHLIKTIIDIIVRNPRPNEDVIRDIRQHIESIKDEFDTRLYQERVNNAIISDLLESGDGLGKINKLPHDIRHIIRDIISASY